MKRTITAAAMAAVTLTLGACSSTSDDAKLPATSAAMMPSATADAPAPAAAPVSDPRCVAASEDAVIAVSNGLTDETLALGNTQVIVDGDLTFFGASTVRPDGKFENRSDVWVLSGLMPFASTGGARSATKWPKASAAPLQISAGDERVQAVDACVVNLTRSAAATPQPTVSEAPATTVS